MRLVNFEAFFSRAAGGVALTLQEVQLTGGDVEAHEVEAAGGPAAAPLSCRLPGSQTLQHAALPGPVQTEDQDLALATLLLLLPGQSARDRHKMLIRHCVGVICSVKRSRGYGRMAGSPQGYTYD